MTKSSHTKSHDILINGNKYRKSEAFESSGHLKEAFYKKQLERFYPNYKTRWEHLRIYRHFKKRYPTLDKWFKEDLVSRVGRESSDVLDKKFDTRISYRSRWYIHYLCIFGLQLDYPYLFSLRSTRGFTTTRKRYNLDYGLEDLKHTIRDLNYSEVSPFSEVRWVCHRIMMHTQKKHYREITLDDLDRFEQAADDYCSDKNISIFWDHVSNPNIHRIKSSIYRLHLALYVLGVFTTAPRKHYKRVGMIELKHKNISSTIINYIKQISFTKEKATTDNSSQILYKFALWLENEYPDVNNLNQLTRSIIDCYLDYVKHYLSKRTGQKYTVNYLSSIISALKVFFDESIYFGYQDVPQYKLLFNFTYQESPEAYRVTYQNKICLN